MTRAAALLVMFAAALLILGAALIAVAPSASAQAAVTYQTYRFTTDSTGTGRAASFNAEAAAIYSVEFAAVGRAAPTTATPDATLPEGTRLFEAFVVAEDAVFGYAEVHEATSAAPYRTWTRLAALPPVVTPTGADLDELIRLTARDVIGRMGWTPVEPPPPAPDSFWVYGPNPSTTGALRANVPAGWSVQWFDALGRVLATTPHVAGLASGTYWALGTVAVTRERQSRRALVARSQ